MMLQVHGESGHEMRNAQRRTLSSIQGERRHGLPHGTTRTASPMEAA